MNWASTLDSLFTGLAVVCGYVALPVVLGFFVRLRWWNHETWRDLGSPWPIKMAFDGSGEKYLRFVFAAGYKRSADPWLRALARATVLLTWLCGLSLLAAVLVDVLRQR